MFVNRISKKKNNENCSNTKNIYILDYNIIIELFIELINRMKINIKQMRI